MAVLPINEDTTYMPVNAETGEIIEGAKHYHLKPGDTVHTEVITGEQHTYAATHVKDFNKDRFFTKFFYEMIPYLEKEITGTQWFFCCKLCAFVSYDDCLLRPYGDGRREPFLNAKELLNYMDVPQKTFYRNLKILLDKEILVLVATGDKTAYMLNPYIFFKGQDIDSQVLDVLKTTRWAKYNDEITGIKEKEHTILRRAK